MRLDKYLYQKYSYSRNFLQHLIKNGAVEVNNKVVTKKSFEVREGDIVEIKHPEKFFDESILDEAAWVELPILEEKKEWVVIYKPGGVLSHPGSSWDLKTPSVAAWARNKYRPKVDYSKKGNNWEFLKAGLVHRLDKDTSWIMLIAKTQRALEYFQMLFKQKSEKKSDKVLAKHYKALVWSDARWKLFLNSITKTPYMIDEIVKPKNLPIKEFKKWVTLIKSFESVGDNLYLIDIQLVTGRTHQIRYHLFSKGLKIIGDPLYGIRKDINLAPCFSPLFKGNMALEAYSLRFEDMDWNQIKISV